ncbi:hypothetical protein DSO57_1013093 [Entomophthora muscae]|uniref:Uncharacterized protein n=1 Tax=Entomophthora muscae TaxID=34485 RepID=A0ACC2T5W4_9FUNG|nr:hypothetical protein DSO57_1013093 [Entomophthora muscae]
MSSDSSKSDLSEKFSTRRKGVQRRRLVRKESWCSYLFSLPFDVWLGFSESFQVWLISLFDHELQSYLSFFIGIGLNAAAVWSRYRMQKRKYSPSDLIPGELVTLFSEGGFGTEHSFLLLPTILFIFSILNAVFLFTRVREYTLFHADLRRHVDSRGILKSSSLDYVKFTQPEIIDQDEDKGTFRKVLSFVWSWIVSIFFQELPTEQTTSNVLVLSLWNGPMFPLSINIFW